MAMKTEEEIMTEAKRLEDGYKKLGKQWSPIISAEDLVRMNSSADLKGFTNFMTHIGIPATKKKLRMDDEQTK